MSKWKAVCETQFGITATLAAQLQEPTPRYNATLHLDELNASHVLSGEQGTLRARLHVQGTGFVASQRRAGVELRLETHGLTLAPGLTARIQGNLTGDTVRLEDVQVRSVPYTLVARGTLSPSATAPAPTRLTYGSYHKTGLEGCFTWADEQLLTPSHLRLQHQELAWEMPVLLR